MLQFATITLLVEFALTEELIIPHRHLGLVYPRKLSLSLDALALSSLDHFTLDLRSQPTQFTITPELNQLLASSNEELTSLRALVDRFQAPFPLKTEGEDECGGFQGGALSPCVDVDVDTPSVPQPEHDEDASRDWEPHKHRHDGDGDGQDVRDVREGTANAVRPVEGDALARYTVRYAAFVRPSGAARRIIPTVASVNVRNSRANTAVSRMILSLPLRRPR
ncbi:hypothetical protein B0H12DRAFT_1241235 [Mycena haematopus]|nr:hypothetical protein B0H12DRAFT_1241235 [Mycena haematopus]